MSALNYNISKRTRALVQLAVFAAIIILMSFTPIGFLRIGPISITLIPLPVAIGAVLLGQKGGAILGFVFGLVSFLQCFLGDPFGAVLIGVSPVLAAILLIVPRILCGWLPALLFDLIRRKSKSNTIPCLVASISCPLFNTLFFTIFLFFLFGTNAEVLDYIGAKDIFNIIAILLTTNALVEAGVGAVVGFPVSKALTHILPKAKQ